MGRNFWVKIDEHEPCPECGRSRSIKLHIGKSSVGWCFSIHVIPERGLNSWEEWKVFLKHKRIYDEYDRRISFVDLVEIVEERSFLGGEELGKRYIHGCERHPIDGYCIGWGSGTWDLITGDFS